MMHRAKIAQVPNGMGCDGRVPPRENTPEPLGTSPLAFGAEQCRGFAYLWDKWEMLGKRRTREEKLV